MARMQEAKRKAEEGAAKAEAEVEMISARKRARVEKHEHDVALRAAALQAKADAGKVADDAAMHP